MMLFHNLKFYKYFLIKLHLNFSLLYYLLNHYSEYDMFTRSSSEPLTEKFM